MSMIRVRTIQGKASEVKNGAFVEVCDDEGTVAAIVYRNNKTGEVQIITPEDETEATYYKKLFDVEFCDTLVEVPQTVTEHRKGA